MGIKVQDIDESCSCGSGLRFKDCHLKGSLPDEHFTVKITRKTEDYFEVYEYGEWKRVPGRPRLQISAIDSQSRHQDIVDSLKPLRGITDIQNIKLERFDKIVKELHLEKDHDSTITWTNRVNKLQHKLNSLKYHMNNHVKHEKEFEEECKKEYTDSVVELEEIDPVYIHETESFLFQTKSTLDIIAQLIGIAYRLTGVVTYANDGNDLIDKIQKSSSYRNNVDNKEKLIKVLEENMEWIRNFVNMRDLITHFSDLLGSRSVIHAATSENDEFADIYYPSMPNKVRITTFMNGTWKSITELINDISHLICDLYNSNLNSKT